jgi:dolichol-phosphate mannosyltransferase
MSRNRNADPRDVPPGDAALIVIPTYNELEVLPSIVQAVRDAVPTASILVVDDNSPDGTGRLADELALADRQVLVLHRPAKEGLGAAYREAFRWGLSRGWRWLVQMDADFSHDPRDVPRLLQALRQGADLAIGSRYVAGGATQHWGLGRRAISRGGNVYARGVLGVDVNDLTAGFKAWRSTTLERIELGSVDSRGYGFQIEMSYRAIRAGMRVVELPVLFCDRRVGASKMSRAIVLEALTLVWRLRVGGG